MTWRPFVEIDRPERSHAQGRDPASQPLLGGEPRDDCIEKSRRVAASLKPLPGEDARTGPGPHRADELRASGLDGGNERRRLGGVGWLAHEGVTGKSVLKLQSTFFVSVSALKRARRIVS
jgi:hypothetical protein